MARLSRLSSLTTQVMELTHFVKASLFRFNRSCPVCAPLSLPFIAPSDCRVGNTGSRSYRCQIMCNQEIQPMLNRLTPLPDMTASVSRRSLYKCAASVT